MLKSLLKLFCETFLTHKSEWIGRQAFPSRRVSLPVDSREYIPPSDGWIGFYRNPSDMQYGNGIYSYGTDGKIVSRIGTRTESFFTGTIPVKKGYRVVIEGDGPLLELWFSPSVGGK